jgi:hypothetical protein
VTNPESPSSSVFQVHVLPVLIRRPQRLLNFRSILDILLGILRSASFLSAFVSSFWAAVCFTRTLAVARVLPEISHDFYDGPFGCVMVGCLVCGSSIWIESGRRRGEMALYVLPRAIRACLPDRWLRSGRKGVHAIEQLVFFCAGIERTYILTRLHPQDSIHDRLGYASNCCCPPSRDSARPVPLDARLYLSRSKRSPLTEEKRRSIQRYSG